MILSLASIYASLNVHDERVDRALLELAPRVHACARVCSARQLRINVGGAGGSDGDGAGGAGGSPLAGAFDGGAGSDRGGGGGGAGVRVVRVLPLDE